jgi:hypothetical protein
MLISSHRNSELHGRVLSCTKIKWTTFDRERLGLLLSQLKEHNENLRHLIRGSTEEVLAVAIRICGEGDLRTMGILNG